MADYQIIYLDSEGDNYYIDGCDNPFLKIGIVKPEAPDVIFPLTIYWATDEAPTNRIDAHNDLTLHQIGAALRTIETAIDDIDFRYVEFYSDLFYDDETEEHSKTLTFSL